MRFRSRRKVVEQEELEITAFMNLMVVLVPFLLLSAAFSQITVLDLNIPSLSVQSAAQDEKPKLALEVVIRKEGLELRDLNLGPLKQFAPVDDGTSLLALNEKLQEIKSGYTEVKNITLLLESDIAYEQLIQVMDAVRSYRYVSGEESLLLELFPEISIGDAPERG